MGDGVLRFRLSPRIEDLVVRRWGSVDGFHNYVNDAANVKYVFEQQYRRRLAGVDLTAELSTVLVCGPIKIVIGEPYGWDSMAVPVIKAIVNASKDDRNEAFGHRPLESDVQFLRVEQSSGHKPPRFRAEPCSPAAPKPEHDDHHHLIDGGGESGSNGGPVETAPRPVQPWNNWRRPRDDEAPEGGGGEKKRRRPARPKRPEQAREPGVPQVDYYPLYKEGVSPGKVPVYCEQEKEWRWIRADGKYCTTCGRPLPPLPACPACGADLLPHRGLYCAKCQARLPPDLAVPPEVAISLRTREYSEASERTVEAVEAIANRLRRGRDERRTIMGPVLIVHLEPRNERDISTARDAEEARAALETLAVGTVITDPYELKVVRQRVGLARAPATRDPEPRSNKYDKDKDANPA